MDTHLSNIESYLATMQTPIQMLNARSQANKDYERESWLQLNELQDIEKFTDFSWASSEILRDPFEQKRFVLLNSKQDRLRFLEGVTGYDHSGTFPGSPWKRQFSGSSGPHSRGSFGSGSGSPSVGGFAQFNNAGFSNIGGTSNSGVDGTSNVGGYSQFVSSGSPNKFRRREGFQVSNTNPQFRTSSAAELLERFNLSYFNRIFGSNNNNGEK
ncbi:unnamed protein product [Arabis nemorensis]|uniref:Uncharacterized protein n=1 Tax=Arabis nemorensis TaxID=586526 RepID=A0A565BJL8_9BRAS|nr:unnamed protein product [Arabis nemorensis]